MVGAGGGGVHSQIPAEDVSVQCTPVDLRGVCYSYEGWMTGKTQTGEGV